MDNCLKTDKNYVDKIKKTKSFIISLRNDNNEPQVSIEIDCENNKAIQVLGKKNQKPSKKHNDIIMEFVLFINNIVGGDIINVLLSINSNVNFLN